MRQNKGFVLKEIENIPYLLPYGQMIADRKRGMQINATGAYLWNLLEQVCTLDELIEQSAKYYEVPTVDLEEFQNDISRFVQQLVAYGIVIEDPDVDANADCMFFSISMHLFSFI